MHIALQKSLVLGGPKVFPLTHVWTVLHEKSQRLTQLFPISERGRFQSPEIARFTSRVAKACAKSTSCVFLNEGRIYYVSGPLFWTS